MAITKEWLEEQSGHCRGQWLDHLRQSASYEGAMEAFRLVLAELDKVDEEAPDNVVPFPEQDGP